MDCNDTSERFVTFCNYYHLIASRMLSEIQYKTKRKGSGTEVPSIRKTEFSLN